MNHMEEGRNDEACVGNLTDKELQVHQKTGSKKFRYNYVMDTGTR